MIPKIIHYTWFSDDPFPDKVQECIDSWHRHMPDYEYVLWDAKRIRGIDSPWLHECIAERKWAFASDFIRVYAVYHFGGIYLDTDCRVFKSFNPLLQHLVFMGREWTIHADTHPNEQYLTSHCFGAVPGHPFIKRCLEYYKDRRFILSNDTTLCHRLRYNELIIPFIQSELAKHFGYNPRPSKGKVINQLEEGLIVYPSIYFDPYTIQPETFCQHLALGSWRDYQFFPDIVQRITLSYRIRYHIHESLFKLFDRLGYIWIKKD